MRDSNGYGTVRIPVELDNEIIALIGTRGFRSKAEIVKEALRLFLDDHKPRLEHFNLDETGVRILDRKLNLIVDVFFTPKGIQCELDKSSNCDHVKFALSVPNIQKVIRKKRKESWNLPEV